MKTAKIISSQPSEFSIPWVSPDTWQAVNSSIFFHLIRYPEGFEHAEKLAQDLNQCLSSLFPICDALCVNSCPWCPEPCCLKAKIWYDFQDLLFLHMNHQPIPLCQPLSHFESTCRYFGHRGCGLPRIIRPWICTWYLCPVQTANLRKRNYLLYEAFNRNVEEIKALRKAIEHAFIKVVS